MRKLAVLVFQTLDGVMQAPASPDEDRSGDFAHGGWAAPYWSDVMAQVMAEAMAEPYDLLLGRKTYDLFAGHFPNAGDDPVSNKLNSARKYVATSTSKSLEWHNSVILNGDIAKEVSQLKEQEGPLLQVHGSWQLLQLLHDHQLIDEFRLWTFPVMLGSGKRLFDQGESPIELELIKSGSTSNGVVMSFYRPKGTAQ